MLFLGKLGIDLKLLLAQIFNFGLLLWALNKLIYQPIMKQLENDEQELAKAKETAKKLEEERIALQNANKQKLAQANQQARAIIKEAEEIAQNIKEKSRQETEQEKQAVIKQIHQRLREVENEQQSVPKRTKQ